jgi:hypothetical protein
MELFSWVLWRLYSPLVRFILHLIRTIAIENPRNSMLSLAYSPNAHLSSQATAYLQPDTLSRHKRVFQFPPLTNTLPRTRTFKERFLSVPISLQIVLLLPSLLMALLRRLQAPFRRPQIQSAQIHLLPDNRHLLHPTMDPDIGFTSVHTKMELG